MKTTTKPEKAKESGQSPKVGEKSSTKINDVLSPTADSRIKKLETFQILAAKHKFLTEKGDDLQKFIASSDGMKEKVTLKNDQGFSFEVSNSSVIGKVIEVIESELTTITGKSEKEVLSFTI